MKKELTHDAAPGRMAVVTLGCRVNQAESGALASVAHRLGYTLAGPGEPLDLVLVNTCAVTAESERQARQALRKLTRDHPRARVIATGCYAQRDPEALAAIPGVALVIGNGEKAQLAQLAPMANPPGPAPPPDQSQAPGAHPPAPVPLPDPAALDAPLPTCDPAFSPPPAPSVRFPPIPSPSEKRSEGACVDAESGKEGAGPHPGVVRVGDPGAADIMAAYEPLEPEGRARADIVAQNGCDESCAFCLIPSVRGASRSMPVDAVCDQARQRIDQGFAELVLTGINLGAFGRDLDGDVTLSHLVEQILRLPGLGRLRLSSISPQDIDARFLDQVAPDPRLCPHLHLSIQSGSDLILKRMRRRHNRARVIGLAGDLREIRPSWSLGADLIVGFPTENEDDFAQTESLVSEAGLSQLHVFRYSDRPGTTAAKIPARFRAPGPVVRERAARLRQAGERMLLRALEGRIGERVEVLVEGWEAGLAQGRSGGYQACRFLCPEPDPTGRLVAMRAEAVDGKTLCLIGRVEPKPR